MVESENHPQISEIVIWWFCVVTDFLSNPNMLSHTIHVCYIYLHLVTVGKYTVYRIPYMDAMGMVWIGFVTMSTTCSIFERSENRRKTWKNMETHGNTWGKLGTPPIGHALHLRMLRISTICQTISRRKGMTFQKMKFHIYLFLFFKDDTFKDN